MIKEGIEQKIILVGFGLALFLMSSASVLSYWNLTGGFSLASLLNPMLLAAIANSLGVVLLGGVYCLLWRSLARFRRSEKALRETEQEHARFFNLSLDMLAIANFDGYFIHLNPAWESTLGFTLEELKAQPFIAFVHPEDVEATLAEIKKQESGTLVFSFENRYRCKDGSYKWIAWTSVPFLEEGLIYAVARDASKCKQAEAVLQQANEELESRVEERTAALRQANDELVAEIVEHRQAQEALRTSEERFRVALKNSPTVVFSQDTELRYTWIYNPAGGVKSEDVVGKSDAELFPEDAEQLAAIKRRVLTTGVGTREETFVTLNGEVRYFDVTVEPLHNQAGQVTGLTCAATDITQVRAREQQLRAIFEGSLAAIAIADDEGVYVEANPAACELFGVPLPELLGKQIADFMEPGFDMEGAWRFFLQQGQLTGEVRLVRPDGTVRDAEYAAKANFLPGRHLSIVRDITERKQAEAALHESQRLIQQITDTTPYLLYIYDRVRDCNIYANRRCEEFFGYTQAQMQAMGGQFVTEVLHPEDFPHLAQLEERYATAKEGEVLESEVRAKNANGEWRCLRLWEVVFTRNAEGLPEQILGTAIDISDKKQVEKALRVSEERLRTAFKAAHMGSWDWNILTGQVTWSENFQEFLGIESGSLDGSYESFIAMIHPEDRDRVFGKVERLFREGGNYKDEFRIVLPDGNIRWLASQGRVFHDETGRPVRLTGIDLDITERKLSEEARRKTEELYRTLVTNFPNGVVTLFDRDLRYTLTEGKELAEVGLPKEFLEGKTIAEIFPPEVCEIKERVYRAAFEGNCTVCEIPFGDRFYLMYTLPVRNERGEIYAGMSMSQNISDRKRAELALLEERNFISAILDTAGAIIMVYDGQGKTIRANRACEKITGYSSDEIEGRDFWELFLIPEEIESVKAMFRDLQAGKFPINHENHWVMRDGSRRLLSWSNTVLLDADSSVKYIISIGIDITDRQRAEEMRRALEQEQELSNLRLRFFSMASHEFRTPLSTILMSAQILESFSGEWSQEKRTRNLRRIEVAAKMMKQMLDDILTINRAETGKLEFNPTQLNLEQLCHRLVEEMRLYATPQHTLTFVSNCQDKTVCADENLLHFILTNLLSNAIKYSPQGGEIQLVLMGEGGEISFQIHDRGIGIPQKDQPHLFEVFYRGENVRSIPGSGLGLTIVKKCVELHSGSISVRSEVGVGTTFTITIPV
jgi:PAS domain S-box-containing protein